MFRTPRLDLIQVSTDSVNAAIHDRNQLAKIVNAAVPETWPPELLDTAALEWTLRWLANPANDPAFSGYWMVLREPRRVLIGMVGFKGMPNADGCVEIGYGVVEDHRRQGYASEGARALVEFAFSHANVQSVAAETYPNLIPSLGVMEKCGMKLLGDGSEPGVVRYAVTRSQTAASGP
jgi:[ribosomal protein S5]-alanine N-acetyltransferase